MKPSWILTDDAAEDLRAIIRYSRDTWGRQQARSYAETLEDCFAQLAADPARFRNMGEVYPGLRLAHCGHHYIFCLPREDAPALIVAVLHERMDLMLRLAARLQAPKS